MSDLKYIPLPTLLVTDVLAPFPTVATYASLPAPGSVPINSGYYVLTETGAWYTFNKKLRGWYVTNGSAWEYGGDLSKNASDTYFDNTGTSYVSANVQAVLVESDVRLDGKVDESVLTAKGSIYVANAASDILELAVGADTKVLTANSAAPLGVSWEDGGSSPVDAANVSFDNTGTSYLGNNVQDVLEEVDGSLTLLSSGLVNTNANVANLASAIILEVQIFS